MTFPKMDYGFYTIRPAGESYGSPLTGTCLTCSRKDTRFAVQMEINSAMMTIHAVCPHCGVPFTLYTFQSEEVYRLPSSPPAVTPTSETPPVTPF